MKSAEVRKLSKEDLKSEATRLRRELFDLRCQLTTEKVADNSRIGKTRKDLARVLTEQNSRKGANAAGGKK